MLFPIQWNTAWIPRKGSVAQGVQAGRLVMDRPADLRAAPILALEAVSYLHKSKDFKYLTSFEWRTTHVNIEIKSKSRTGNQADVSTNLDAQ